MRYVLAMFSLVFMLWVPPAEASHYPLESVVWLEELEVNALQGQQIRDTEDLLRAALNPAARAALSTSTGLSDERLIELAIRTDLLQIPGVGPDTVEAMRSAGVSGVADLLTREPSALRDQLAEAYASLGRTADLVPPIDSLEQWIVDARSVPLALAR